MQRVRALRSNSTCKIAFVVADGIDAQGGIERMTAYLTRDLKRRYPEMPFVILKTRMSPGTWGQFSVPIAVLSFVHAIILHRIDIVHINMAPRGSTFRKMIYIFAARRLKKNVVVHLHGSGYDDFFQSLPSILRWLVRKCLSSSDKLIVLGDYWADFAGSQLRVPRDRICIVNNGVPEADRRADLTGTPPRMIFLGQLGTRKGVDILITSMVLLKTRNVDCQLTVGGGGDLEGFRKLAAEKGVGDRITFLGWVGEEAVHDLLVTSDVFVLPSRAENQPVAILEAMARGLPVVSTKIGAIPEQVLDGNSGYLVPPGDAEALADALAKLLTDPRRRQEFGNAAYALWQEKFSLSNTTDIVAGLYTEMVK